MLLPGNLTTIDQQIQQLDRTDHQKKKTMTLLISIIERTSPSISSFLTRQIAGVFTNKKGKPYQNLSIAQFMEKLTAVLTNDKILPSSILEDKNTTQSIEDVGKAANEIESLANNLLKGLLSLQKNSQDYHFLEMTHMIKDSGHGRYEGRSGDYNLPTLIHSYSTTRQTLSETNFLTKALSELEIIQKQIQDIIPLQKLESGGNIFAQEALRTSSPTILQNYSKKLIQIYNQVHTHIFRGEERNKLEVEDEHFNKNTYDRIVSSRIAYRYTSPDLSSDLITPDVAVKQGLHLQANPHFQPSSPILSIPDREQKLHEIYTFLSPHEVVPTPQFMNSKIAELQEVFADTPG